MAAASYDERRMTDAVQRCPRRWTCSSQASPAEKVRTQRSGSIWRWTPPRRAAFSLYRQYTEITRLYPESLNYSRTISCWSQS